MTLEWSADWARFSAGEYLAVGLLVVLLVAFVEIRPRVTHRWEHPIRIDDAVRERLRNTTSQGRRRAGRISDSLLWCFTLAPFVLALVLHAFGATDVATQVALLSTLAVLAASGANRVATTVAGRPRPYTRVLDANGDLKRRPHDHPERLRSFFSGHTALATTGASLVAVFVVQLGMVSGLLVLVIVGLCAVGSITVGLLRVAADRHYFSDVVVGVFVGLACGAGFPWFIHFAA